MAVVKKEMEIAASAYQVFDLISRVEEFARYSRHIKEIRKTGPRTYLWRVEFLGIPFEWTADVKEYERPSVFAWQSTEGIYNSGRYTIAPLDGRTLVTFEMEFNPPLIPKVITAAVLNALTDSITEGFLENIKKTLEGA
ncbi:MAG: SRPBCC family protein [Deltaproteobacteria bacterium]|nr:SRPBCC family protein [Deltaproteobacteria bacterium]